MIKAIAKYGIYKEIAKDKWNKNSFIEWKPDLISQYIIDNSCCSKGIRAGNK